MIVPNSSKPAAGERQKIALVPQLRAVWNQLSEEDQEALEVNRQEGGTAKRIFENLRARGWNITSVRTVEERFAKIIERADKIVNTQLRGEAWAADWIERKLSVKLIDLYDAGFAGSSTAGLRQPWDPPAVLD